MTSSDAPAAGGLGSSLLDSWRAASMAAGWLHPGDWPSAAAEVMAHALSFDEGVEAAAALLGADRAGRGVGLAEGLTDLLSLYAAAGTGEPPFVVAREFAQGWSEVSTEALLARGSIDAATGLVTPDYLAARIAEIFAEERATGVPAGDTWCVIRVTPLEDVERAGVFERVARARVILDVLDRGESNAVLDSGTMVSLAKRASASEDVVRLRYRLRESGDESVAVSVAALPGTREEALAAFREL